MNEIIRFDRGELLSDSRMIAEYFNKSHNDVLKDIRNEIGKLEDGGAFDEGIFSLTSYTDQWNRKMPCYTMNEEGIMQLAARYDAVARRKLIVKIKELKKQYGPTSEIEILLRAAQALADQERKLKVIEHSVDSIKDTIVSTPDHWRDDINRMINKIVKAVGNQDFSRIRTESYTLLEQRAGVNLKQRLANMRNRLIDEGASQSKVKNLNNMDVIEQDKKLKEIYMSIVKEYFIKYCA